MLHAVLFLSLATNPGSLDACLAAQADASPDDVVAACADATEAGDAATRVMVRRKLARAHALLGHDEDASAAWFSVLLLSGAAHPDASASERERRAFAVASNRLFTDAPLIVRATRRAGAPELFDVTLRDPGGRVLSLALYGPGVDGEPVALERGADGVQRGVVSLAPMIEGRTRVAATLEALSLDGTPASSEPLALFEWPAADEHGAAIARSGGGALLVGAGAVGLLYGIGTVVTWANAAAEAERARAAGERLPECLGWCVGEKPYLLGVSGDDKKTLDDGGASGWMTAGALIATTGLLLTAGGVFVLVTGGE